jgi:hypothetical protein
MADINVNFTIKDISLDYVLDGLDGAFPGRVGHTKAQWAKMIVIKFVKDEVRKYWAMKEANNAKITELAKPEPEIE